MFWQALSSFLLSFHLVIFSYKSIKSRPAKNGTAKIPWYHPNSQANACALTLFNAEYTTPLTAKTPRRPSLSNTYGFSPHTRSLQGISKGTPPKSTFLIMLYYTLFCLFCQAVISKRHLLFYRVRIFPLQQFFLQRAMQAFRPSERRRMPFPYQRPLLS